MIGQLRGKLVKKNPPLLMVEVQGVGYWVQSPLSTFFVLPEIGGEVLLNTHFIVREDAQLLFGFLCEQECHLFQEIIKVNGVGPKVALAILSGLSSAEFVEILMTKETARLQKLPGIGAKTAQRILVEMQDKVAKFALSHPMITNNLPISLSSIKEKPKEDAIMALISLGYKPQEASKAVSKVNTNQSCEWIIKEALQGLAKV